MRQVLIFFSVMFVIACTSPDHAESLKKFTFQIDNLNENIRLNNQDAIMISYFKLNNNDFYVSSFKNIKTENFVNFISKRRTTFLDLFIDDTEPYTGKLIQKSQCLKKVMPLYVEFLSGPEKNWSDCFTNKRDLSKTPAIRLWYLCQDTAWEITAKSTSIKEISLKCF